MSYNYCMVVDPEKRVAEIGEDALHFIEKFGMLFEHAGQPPMLGRVLGWLLICDPPEQSLGQISKALQASTGSISTSLQTLTHLEWVKRSRVPGNRTVFFSIPSGVWSKMLRKRMEFVTSLKQLAEEGLEIAQLESDKTKSRLHEMHKVYTYMENELPAMIDRLEDELEV